MKQKAKTTNNRKDPNSKSLTKEKPKVSKSTTWKELIEAKTEFVHILRVLNRFYESRFEGSENEAHNFRKKMAEESNVDALKVYFKWLGKYEYMVYGEIQKPDSIQSMTWIHIDGIAEEREHLKKNSLDNHPVFGITCMTDLFQNHAEFRPEFSPPS